MSKLYSLEFAVKSSTELKAMSQLEARGIARAKHAKLSDLDRQAGLFIIRVDVEEAELTDDVYQKLLADKDVFILSDELSAKRAQKVISLTNTVERQLKKLLICVLPETEKVFNDIINTHQKHGSELKPTNRIEWCRKIDDFSFGELPKVLEEDVSKLARDQLLTKEGLLALITSSKDFDSLKSSVVELSQPKIVWDNVSAILEKPIEYSYIAGALSALCAARNDAAHLNTITAKRLAEVAKHQKHAMSHISDIKSSYRENLQTSMKSLTESMKPILDLAAQIDPSAFISYQKMMSETFKPFINTISKLKLNIVSPDFTEAIRKNANYQAEVAKSFAGVIDNMKALDGFQDTIKQFTDLGFSNAISASMKEAIELKLDIGKIAESKKDEGKK